MTSAEKLLQAELPAQAQRDADGRILLTPWDLDHAEYVRHAYGQIRLYAGAHPQTLLFGDTAAPVADYRKTELDLVLPR